MAAEWFYQAKGQQLGPVEPAVLRRLANGGIVKADTPVRKGVDGPWVPAKKLRGLWRQSDSPPSPGKTPPAASAAGREFKSVPPPPAPIKPPPLPPAAPPSLKCGRPVPYGLLFAWGWTILLGYFLLFLCDFGRYGPAALYLRNVPIVAGSLLFPVLLLVIPALRIGLPAWRRTKSPAAGVLLAVNALIIILLIAKQCRPPEPLSTFGLSGTSTHREEAKQATNRLEDRFLKMVETPSGQSGAVARGGSPSEMGVKSHGVVGEIERLLTEAMNDGAQIQNDYQRELDAIGWITVLKPTRKTLMESRAILSKAKEVVQRYRARDAAYMKAMRLKIADFNVGSDLKQEMRQAFDRGMKTWQPKMDRIWDLEEQAVSEVGKMIDLLDAKSGSWTVVKGKILFQADEDAEKYNGLLSNVQRCAAERERILKEAVDATKTGFARMREGL